MTFQARHRWMIQRLHLGLGFEDEKQVEELMKTNGILDLVNQFFQADGPSRIFFSSQTTVSTTNTRQLFVINNGLNDTIQGRVLFFAKVLSNEAKVDPLRHNITPIDPAIANDHRLTYGVLDSSLFLTLGLHLSHLFMPLLTAREEEEWGSIEKTTRNELMLDLQGLISTVQENIKTLNTGFELRKPEKAYDVSDARSLSKLASNEAAVQHFVELLKDWCQQTEAYVDETDAMVRWETAQAGPATEVTYWKRRLERLVGLTNQLKTKECQMVLNVLTIVVKLSDTNNGADKKLSIAAVLRHWKQIDGKLTNASNEAKDNVKYLSTLEWFFEPLYTGTPSSVLEILPPLMNAIKLLHTIARYYNTTERMTTLWMKITNQLVTICTTSILGKHKSFETLWHHDPRALISTLESCLRLNQAYQDQYRATKEKLLAVPKGKHFDFSETQIFGPLDLFARRIEKLVDLFRTVHQFDALADMSLDGITPLVASFRTLMDAFRAQKHNLLDVHDTTFDRDYTVLQTHVTALETALQQQLNDVFASISSIQPSLQLLHQLQQILHRETLQHDLAAKVAVIFHTYGREIVHIQEVYELHRYEPPLARNVPPVAGNLLWARHLFHRIEEPMRHFEAYGNVLTRKEAKQVIQTYNKVARTLVAFEELWYEAWCRSIESARACLHATLFISHPTTGQVFVNFDHEIRQLIQEARWLERLEIDVPENARMVLLQEEHFTRHYTELKELLQAYDHVRGKIVPVIAPLLRPHVALLEEKLRPGIETLTWTSLNIDAFTAAMQRAVHRLDELLGSVVDVLDNRIEKHIIQVAKASLVALPTDQSFQLEDFVRMQEKHVASLTQQLAAKNVEIENAVDDVVRLISASTFDGVKESGSISIDPDAIQTFRNYYQNLLYRALVTCTKQSLNALKKRVSSRASMGFLFLERPFFQVDVQLSVPSVRMSPSLEEIQNAITRSALAVLRCTQNLYEWGHRATTTPRSSFFDRLGCDTEIIKVAILLTGALHGTKTHVQDYLAAFQTYDWLWKDEKELRYTHFLHRRPMLSDYEEELQQFQTLEAKLALLAPVHNIAVFSLHTTHLKLQLRNECRQWRVHYAEKVHEQARTALFRLMDVIRTTRVHLATHVTSFEAFRFVLDVLNDVREREAAIEMELSSIDAMYAMLERFLPPGSMANDELEHKNHIRNAWQQLVEEAEQVADHVAARQGNFKRELMNDVRAFQIEVTAFQGDYEANGPMVVGLDPIEAMERLARFTDLLSVCEGKQQAFRAGEDVFGLRGTEYPELVRIRQEMTLLEQLYRLYVDVETTIDDLKGLVWSHVGANVDRLVESFTAYDERCKKMPKKLWDWEAFSMVRQLVAEYLDLLPLVRELTRESIKARHWNEIYTTCQRPRLENDRDNSFQLHQVLELELLSYKEEVESIYEKAQKELQIEHKLREVTERWATTTFEFSEGQERRVPVLKRSSQLLEELEDSQLQLQALLGMRHVVFFRDHVQATLARLSTTADVLELWTKVQTHWLSLEAVFTSGDIAKQLPVEAKRFAKIDKDWHQVMAKAVEMQLVVVCCAHDVVRVTLLSLFEDLETCQKSLEGYLEQKRQTLPRLYFVSTPLLLVMLSRGSEPTAMQPYYEKIFDSISHVVYERSTTALHRKIVAIQSLVGDEEETIALVQPVIPSGNLEDWLRLLEHEMHRTLQTLARQAASECLSRPFRDFVMHTCAQFALLGLQLNWTSECEHALQRCRKTKGIMAQTAKKQSATLAELSSWCLSDLGTLVTRIKVETLLTSQVHQRDCFLDLCRLVKDKKVLDAHDFEWLKHARFYWRPKQDKGAFDTCVLSIGDVDFPYAFEYLGCKERLVMTPLTDRAYITLSQALSMYLGGAPAGPAGTGKTETVKDLGRSLGMYVIVTNCTDQQRYADVAKILKGLCQGGFWCCFDEFNRIELPVLSVVAQQVLAITTAKRIHALTFAFPGDALPIRLDRDMAYFITMNPGYQGRQELPENLKALFRTVAMMVPDREIIIKVRLCAVGYTSFAALARKFKTLYSVCEDQLSKQRHYDFGLRNILSVLRSAGAMKRQHVDVAEDLLMMMTLREMNLSKLVASDVPLFLSLLQDLFPGIEPPPSTSNQDMAVAIQQVLEQAQSWPSPAFWRAKIMQLYETQVVRHGIALVGRAGAGKTEIVNVVQTALRMCTDIVYRQVRLNPKAIRAEELFGETDRVSGEWIPGVFGALWAKANDRERKEVTWLVCDGPVDAVWIENLNTVLDDNKLLTLANGDRLAMTENCKLVFEVEDLRNASPATVSRAGIVYVSETDLDWKPIADRWLRKRPEPQRAALRSSLYALVGEEEEEEEENAANHLFAFLTRHCQPVVNVPRVALIQSCLNLLESLLTQRELPGTSAVEMELVIDRMVVFAVAWAVGGVLDHDDRVKLEEYLRHHAPASTLPSCPSSTSSSLSLFDHFVHPTTFEWKHWELESTLNVWKDVSDVGRLIVPTIETARTLQLLQCLHTCEVPVLLLGEPGTGKSTLARCFFEKGTSSRDSTREEDTRASRTLILSGSTSCSSLQTSVEKELEKRGGKSFGPSTGEQLTVFLDDLSLPQVNEWGDQPTLELVRQLIETHTLCFLEKDKRGDMKIIHSLAFLAAMRLPRTENNNRHIPARLQRHFFLLNLLPPSSDVAAAIFTQLTRLGFDFDVETTASISEGLNPSLLDLLPRLGAASVHLWLWLRQTMPPSPQKFHYIFTLRDLSRWVQGLVQSPRNITDDRFLCLWQHESERVFADKLTTVEEKQHFHQELTNVVKTLGNYSILEPPGSLVYVDFLQDVEIEAQSESIAVLPRQYEPVTDLTLLRGRVEHLVAQFNHDNPKRALPSLILFDQALAHLTRLTRVLGLCQGHMMLIGVGGSGKQSLARLAAVLRGLTFYQSTVSKTYTFAAFLEDLREVCKATGVAGHGVVFVLNEGDLQDDAILDQINTLLATGQVPRGLFSSDEIIGIGNELQSLLQREWPDQTETLSTLVRFFHHRVRQHLHLVLCLSPVSARFADRCRAYPHLMNGCTVDWYLPWPEEALSAVGRASLEDLSLETTISTKEALVRQLGRFHQAVELVSDEYFTRRRRRVVQTPRSFLSFLATYKALYSEKLHQVQYQASTVKLGLDKLNQGAQDVERMNRVLTDEKAKLVIAEAAANDMLSTLELKSLEATTENELVQQIREQCLADAARILAEKEAAEADLKRAQPFLDEAERAASSIRPTDLNELKKLAKPGDIIKLIFDCVAILQMTPLVKVERAGVTLGVGKDKRTCDFVFDSFQLVKSGMLADTRFLPNIFHFSKHQKDQMNDETLELMAPYMDLTGFTASAAKNASKAAEGLFGWVKAMSLYHEASKVVKPKLEALRIAEGKFEAAQTRLQSSEDKLQACQTMLRRFQTDFESQMAEKARVEAFAQATERKMAQATALIRGLDGEKKRWTDESNRFVERMHHLVGDCALAAAFLCYCGPFNREYRDLLLRERLPYALGALSTSETRSSLIPWTKGLVLDEFLADAGTITDWKLQGLPSDPLSIENGLLVTRAPRFPLLIDPQGQAVSWLLCREASRLPSMGLVTTKCGQLRELLEQCIGEGKALVLDCMDDRDLDPVFGNLLDKDFIIRGKGKFVKLLDRICEYHDAFSLYLTTRVANPHLSPELQARTLVIDFTVTQTGLEEQLLSHVLRQEQRSLEEQMERVQGELHANAKALVALDALLLERLTASEANLLEDMALVSVLANTKAKAMEINEKMLISEQVKRGIDDKRQQYRPVATRGSVLYFTLVEFAAVDAMYQTSLDQFLHLFGRAIDQAERSTLASKRVAYILETLTYTVFRSVTRGLYDRHRLSFLLLLALKLLVAADCIPSTDVSLFLKAGASRNVATEPPNPFEWLPTSAWLNAIQLASEKTLFWNLVGELQRHETSWRDWFDANEPEQQAVPIYEASFLDSRTLSTANLHFHRLLLVRALREDRTIPAVLDFIRTMESIETVAGKKSGARLPALGPRYVEPMTERLETIYDEMRAETPVLYLLSPGGDPTESIEQLARRQRQSLVTISMGEGQQAVAADAVSAAMESGSWVLLQNCHLGLEYMTVLGDTLLAFNAGPQRSSPSSLAPEFRLFLTSESHPAFPMTLLHGSLKVTNEPPAGLRASLLRSFSTLVDQEKLDRLDSPVWRALVFALCFLHAIVLERRKFGSLGFSFPYDFNAGDLLASLNFCERHLDASSSPSWPTMQYMVADVYYGGRITDEFDRRLFRAYCDAWLTPTLLGSSFSFDLEAKKRVGKPDTSFSSGQVFHYALPAASMVEIDEYLRFIAGFPSLDATEVFGLHPNGDVTYRVKEVATLLSTLTSVQATSVASGSTHSTRKLGAVKTREELIQANLELLLASLPGGEEALSEETLAQSLRLGGGLERPLNLFRCQEARAMRLMLETVRTSLVLTQKALANEAGWTPALSALSQAVYEGTVPLFWLANEQAWLAGTLSLWITGLSDRVTQLRAWFDRGRPASFWLGGFVNPQGFLTAMAQECTRAHAKERWALDEVVYSCEVTTYERLEQIKLPPREGVLVHGLSLDGAAWNRIEGTLKEQEPKRLFAPLPPVHITATSLVQKKTRATVDHGPYGAYDAPVYRYARRTDKHYIFTLPLASKDHQPHHWTLRGVALICSTDQ